VNTFVDLLHTRRLLQFGAGGDRTWCALEVTAAQLKTIVLLVHTEGLTSRQIAEQLGVGPSAVTSLVDRLVDQKFVRRERDPADRRRVWVRPLPKARALHDSLNRTSRSALGRVLLALPARRRAATRETLEELLTAARQVLTAQQSAGSWHRTHASHAEDRSHQARRRERPATASRFDRFVDRYNQDRPHQALAMKTPAEVYVPSPRPYRGLPELDYPFHDWTATVTYCGRICFKKRKVNLSQVFAGQVVGVKHVNERVWLVSFMDYGLGYFDDETCRLEPIENPFGPKVYAFSTRRRNDLC
jgi:DNA-binding MarR family transcriptional regulator